MKLKGTFILLLMICALAVRAQTADFTYTTTSGFFCSPQTVTFTQTCSGSPQGFIWDFGNGQSNVHAVDTARYTSPGTYTVKLIGLYADTAIAVTKAIIINPTPSVSISSDALSICQPGNMTFNAAGPGLTTYIWDFGDATPLQTTTSGINTHFFADYGQFTVRVRGITAFGCYGEAAIVAEVRKFTLTGDIGPVEGCIPINAFLVANANIVSPDAAQSYIWDFGDGTPVVTGTTSFILHSYNITTPVTAHLTVISNSGCSSQMDFQPAAYGTVPTDLHAFTVTGRDTFCGNEHILFKAKAIDATGYNWDFGPTRGNSYVEDTFLTWHFADTGWVHAVITPMFHGCPGVKDSFDIYIKGVIAKIDPSNTCSNKNTFLIKDVTSGHVTHYYWTFDDTPGITDSTHFDITHTFPVTGTYGLTLIVKDTIAGCADTLASSISTALPEFYRNKPSVCADSIITYNVIHTYPPFYVKYYFSVAGTSFNNGADSTLTFFALNHGTFNDMVIIDHLNPHVCNDTLYTTTPLRVTGPVTFFTATPDTVCLKIPVVLSNSTHPYFPADLINEWTWDFQDGNNSSVKDPPPHLYAAPGEYTIFLTAKDIMGCALTKTALVVVQPIPEITVYPRKDTICLNRDTAILSAYTIDPFVWTPNANINCNTCDTIKAYPTVSGYYVATATNAGGCSNTDTSFIRVFAPFHAQVSPLTIGVCPKVPVPFNVGTAGVVTWSPPAFLSGTTIPNPVAIPDTSVVYQVIVTDSAGCYADTVDVHLNVYPLPTVDAGPDRLITYGNTFTLSPNYSADVQTYAWTPAGNLDCPSCAQPTGTALQKTLYTIAVTSNHGCKAKDDILIAIACDKAGLYLPSAFTPFNGGTNNYFYPLARGYKSIKTFIIYNRLGNKIFERKDFTPNIATLGWNGMIKGDNTHSTEAFVWFVEAVCEEGETVSSKGTVLLVR